MNIAILYQTHVQNLNPFLLCLLTLPKTIFEDLMMIFTESKVKLISHLEDQYAEEDVLDNL